MSTVSIALCTYNGASHIAEQLESISRQSKVPDQLVICDDGSHDETGVIISNFAQKCSFRVEIYRNERNLGLLKNFETAVSLCDGDIVLFADQDDVWHVDKVALMVSALEAKPDSGYALSDAEIVDVELNCLSKSLWEKIEFTLARRIAFESSRQLLTLLSGPNFAYGATLAIRRRFLPMVFPIDSVSMSIAHDTWTCILLSAGGAPGILVPEKLIKYRQHEGQFTRNMMSPSRLRKSREAEYRLVADTLDVILNRLASDVDLTKMQAAKHLLEEKRNHLRARAAIGTAHFRSRIAIAFSELVAGRYKRYASGVLSALKDVFGS
jgi:glycosyltransferase involved in cell wall biosynthesis